MIKKCNLHRILSIGFGFLVTLMLLGPEPTFAAATAKLMPLEHIRIGMQGTCKTVFRGNQIEDFGFEILGVMKATLGPGQDLILARLTGSKAEYTGVIAGMSGSPCQIQGQLIGALSYRFGAFTKEPIAGITPIANMLAIENLPSVATSTQSYSPQGIQLSGHQHFFQLAQAYLPLPVVYGSQTIRPIATPLSFSGFLPQVVQQYQSELAALGVQPILSSGSNGKGAHGVDMPTHMEPGGTICGQLIRGDMDISGTGTVSYVSGTNVYGFGHPFFNQGRVAIPMAPGYILNTLVSDMGSYKMSQSGTALGTITEDRLTAIYGQIGPKTRMIPVTLDLTEPGQNTPRRIQFEVLQNTALTPMLMLMSIQSSLEGRLGFQNGGNLSVNGQIKLAGQTLPIRNYYSAPPAGSVFGLAARELAQMLLTLWHNPFAAPDITAVHLAFDYRPQSTLASIEEFWTDQVLVQPGEKITLKVRLKNYRQQDMVKHIDWQVPRSLPNGPVDLIVADGQTLGMIEQSVKSGYESFDDMVGSFANKRPNGELYLMVISNESSVARYNQIWPRLPASMVDILNQPNARQHTLALTRSPAAEYRFKLGYDIQGQASLRLQITSQERSLNQ